MALPRFNPIDIDTKVILIGGHQSGKTQLIAHFTKSTENCVYHTNPSGIVRKIDITPEKAVTMKIHEIENFRLILKDQTAAKGLFEGNTVVMCVVDLTNPDSLPTIQAYITDIRKLCGSNPPKFLLIGNKFDELNTVIYKKDLEEFVAEHFLPKPHVISASMGGIGVYQAFVHAGNLAIQWEERRKNFEKEEGLLKIYQIVLDSFINETKEGLQIASKKSIALSQIQQKIYETSSIEKVKELIALTRKTVSEHQDQGWYGMMKGTFFRKTSSQLRLETLFDEKDNLLPQPEKTIQSQAEFRH